MPSYKLTYFNFMGIAEPIRILFHIAGVQFEDKRVPGPMGEGSKEWEKLKPNIGLGNLPVLEVDGKVLPQRPAILRYLAREHGFQPKSSWDIAQVDVVIATTLDLETAMDKYFFSLYEEKDSGKKKTLIKELTESCQEHLVKLEKLLKSNNEGTGWFVGDKITIADMIAFCTLHDGIPTLVETAVGDLSYMTNQEHLKAFVGRFKAEPKVSEWLDKRPKTQF